MGWICPINRFVWPVYIIYRLTDQVTPTDEIRMIKGVINLKIGYIRVSSVDQNEERQRKALERYDIQRWYVDKKSGKDMDRPEFRKMMDYLREDSEDIVYVTELSRLARSTMDLYKIMEIFDSKGIQLVSDKENIDTSSASGRAMFGFFAVMAQFERELLHERQAEGIAIAKAKGKHIGRPYKKYNKELFLSLYKQYQESKITITKIAEELQISRATVYRLVEQQKNKAE